MIQITLFHLCEINWTVQIHNESSLLKRGDWSWDFDSDDYIRGSVLVEEEVTYNRAVYNKCGNCAIDCECK